MIPKRVFLPAGFLIFLVFLLLNLGNVNADPMPIGDCQPGGAGMVRDTTAVRVEDPPKGPTVKNPDGFLQYDGTGYRVVTRDTKPEKASYIRLKPLAGSKESDEKSTVYTLEVVDNKDKEAQKPAKPVEEKPRFAVERVEDLDKKGVGVEPRREHKADVGVGVKVSESSEFILGRGVVVERKENRSLDSRDDGWRFRFKTNF